uniref:Putative secreted protein n=1 Tax=Anopheles marajoara TaxID=58244 RepID=A0A2M4CAV5_9DIPT
MLLPLLQPLTAGLSAPCILVFVWVEEVAPVDADNWTGWSKSLPTPIFEVPVLDERSPELESVGSSDDPTSDWECNSGCCRESLCR